jgi:hypothetical protein
VEEYLWLLESALKAGPHLRCLRRECRLCGIGFLTDPRNAGREDLGCPFGCREAHRKQESTRRSVDYYRTREGKIKKRALNNRRRPRTEPPAPVEPAPVEPIDAEGLRTPRASRWGEPIVGYVRMLCSLIEGRWVGRSEVMKMLGEVLRQHSMARRRRIDHIVDQLNKSPPRKT